MNRANSDMKWFVWVVIIVICVSSIASGFYFVSGDSYPFKRLRSSQMAGGDGVALGGYDVVSYRYFTTPKKGKPEFSLIWLDIRWEFANRQHLDLFRQNPESFVPKFGGFCAKHVSKGFFVEAHPRIWHMSDGNLYLFNEEKCKTEWLVDFPGIVEQAEANWQD